MSLPDLSAAAKQARVAVLVRSASSRSVSAATIAIAFGVNTGAVGEHLLRRRVPISAGGTVIVNGHARNLAII